MGFFSWSCCACKRELVNTYVVQAYKDDYDCAWLSHAAVLIPRRNFHLDIDESWYILSDDYLFFESEYDGYGNVSELNLTDVYEFMLFHKHCWDVLGKPDTLEELSCFPKPGDAPNQGHFLDADVIKTMSEKPELILY
jgi:hypothetical protein